MNTKTARLRIGALVMSVVVLTGGPRAGEIDHIDGVPHIHNDAEPGRGRETVLLEEIWRAGSPDDDEIFGLVTQVLADQSGNIYLLDSQLCEVAVYSPAGERLRTLFREGEGPGEVTQPRNMALLGDESVGVVREFPGQMVRVDRENNPLPNVDIQAPASGGFMIVDACHAGGSTLVLGGTVSPQTVNGIQERVHYLGIFDLDGREKVRLAEQNHRRDFEHLVIAEREVLPSFWWASAVGRDGRIYVAPDRDRYAVEVFAPSGELERVITRDYKHCRRTDSEQQRLYDSFAAAMQGATIPYTIEIERDEYDILALQHGVRIRQDGTLWVLPSSGVRDQPPGTMLTFDVFDKLGHFTSQVSVVAPHNGVWDGFFFVAPERVVVVTGHVEAILAQYGGGSSTYESDDDGSAMEVICYQMTSHR